MIKKEISAILDEPIDLGEVEVPCTGWRKVLQIVGLAKPKKNRLILRGATASTMFRMTSMMEDLVISSDRKEKDSQMYHLMNANIRTLCEILAVAIHNQPEPTPAWLSNAIFTQFSQAEIRYMMKQAYGRLGVEDFFGTLGLIRNISQSASDIPETTPGTPSSVE